MRKLAKIMVVLGNDVVCKRIAKYVVIGIFLFPLIAFAQAPPDIMLPGSCPGGWLKPDYPEPILVNCFRKNPRCQWDMTPGDPVITPGAPKPPKILPGAIPMDLCEIPTEQSASVEYAKKEGINASFAISEYFFTGTIGANTEKSSKATFDFVVPACSYYKLHVEEVETTNTVSVTVAIIRRAFWSRWNPFAPCTDYQSTSTDQPCGTYTPPPITRSTYEYEPKYTNVGCPDKLCPPCQKGPKPPPECPCPE